MMISGQLASAAVVIGLSGANGYKIVYQQKEEVTLKFSQLYI